MTSLFAMVRSILKRSGSAANAGLLVACTLSACATSDRDVRFDSEDGEALLVTAVDLDRRNYLVSYGFMLAQMDPDTGRRLGEPVVIDIVGPPDQLTGRQRAGSDEVGRVALLGRGPVFGARRVVPGTYALVAAARNQTGYCLGNGAPVFEIAPSRISIVPLTDPEREDAPIVLDGVAAADVMAAFDQKREGMPLLTEEAAVVSPIGSVTFAIVDPSEGCSPPVQFSPIEGEPASREGAEQTASLRQY